VCKACERKRPAAKAAKKRWGAKRYDPVNAKHRAALQAVPNNAFVVWLKRIYSTKNKKKDGSLTTAWVAKWSSVTHCRYTGLPFSTPGTRSGTSPCPRSPSLDRIDPSKGYTPANTQVVSYFANAAKNAWPEEQFKLLVLATASNLRS
jgi:hypothetical protein